MGNYQNLNVLNLKKQNDYMSDDAIQDVANMLHASGANRSQRRRLERSLSKVETIMAYSQKHLDKSAFKEYKKNLDECFVFFFAFLALTMGEDYQWREDDTHDQISSLLERVDKKINKYINQGYSLEDIVHMVDEKYNIILIPEEKL